MDPGLRERIQAAARALRGHGATEVYLFGSAARDSLREESDIDMAIRGLPPQVFFRAMAEAPRIIGRPVDLVALDREDDVAETLRRSGDLVRVA